MPEGISVLVADPQPVLRIGLCSQIEADPNLDLVGECGDGDQAIEAIQSINPDVLVIDFKIPSHGAPAVCQALSDLAGIRTRIVIASAELDGAIVHASMSAGAQGHFHKRAAAELAIETIVAVGRGRSSFSPEAMGALAEHIASRRRRNHQELSAREIQALQLLADGARIRGAAAHLNVSETAVKAVLRSAFAKLEVANQTHAVAEGLRQGFLR